MLSPLPFAFAGYAPLPLLVFLSAFGPPPYNNIIYLAIGLFLLCDAMWEQLFGSYLAFFVSPALLTTA